ncbi:alpha-tocopherol transfer protein-like isoform X2 [Culex pipiens pallens]|uniref:alpha-tocopherol transfer protein-like isoform X2 n=1 Tax=Culex pipiens pallens TaxID=42434 RepID=UPI001953AFF4|nr:alpha-tocopherol transfer protein-like isoform X2 [Culex pipiens pallens]
MAPILRVEKKPAREEVYQTSLEPKYQLIARDELHENEYSREPALAQLREFIVKHPQIKQCRMDSAFLLRFLRNRKFNVTAACDAIVRYLTMKTLHPEFFNFDPLHLNKLIGEHLVVPLGQDAEGRLVLLIRYGQFNPEEHSPERQVNMIGLAIETHFDNEQYQVTGIVVVIDMLGISLAHLAVLTVPKLKVMTTITGEMKMVRIKKVHLLRVPSLAAKLAEFWISTTPAKLQQRMKFHKTLDTLKDDIDPEVLPTIYGGKQSLEEANEKFHKLALSQRDRFLKQAEMYIDLSIPAPNAKNANAALQSSVADESVIGSFRKLNVD